MTLRTLRAILPLLLLITGALSARNQQIIQPGTIVKGHLRLERHPIGAHHRVRVLSHHQAALGAATTPGPEGQQLPGTDQVQLFQPRKNQKTKYHKNQWLRIIIEQHMAGKATQL